MQNFHFQYLTATLLLSIATLATAADSTAKTSSAKPEAIQSQRESAATWQVAGRAALTEAKRLKPIPGPAKNVILFIGDGMGVSTVTAARILQGQLANGDGEGNRLSFERFPHLAMSKTYSANQQTPDSAPTMTAIITGAKTNDGVLSVNQNIRNGYPDAAAVSANRLTTLLEQAELQGLATGVVSTARITHATPAATYAHTSMRDWEADSDLPAGTRIPDIASQLVDGFGRGGIGNGLEVVLGGGRAKFLPRETRDPEYPTAAGERRDGRDLTQEFVQKFDATYVWNSAQFNRFDPKSGKRLLGLFEPSHMRWEHDRANDKAGEPSLAEMTQMAIDVLRHNKRGYFLVVEAGRIDHAHHDGNAYRALTDTIALSDAVATAAAKTDAKKTLIVVTADHSHVFTLAGYPKRGNPILGKVTEPGHDAPELAIDGKPYTTLSYANGQGFEDETHSGAGQVASGTGREHDLSRVDTTDPNFHQQALVPLRNETHGGEDVEIFARGPNAYLFHGVQDQTYIYQVMRDALGFK